MADQKTTSELRRGAEITDDEINAAVDAVLAKPETGQYPVGGGYLLGLAAAVEVHEPTRTALANPESRQDWRRRMLRTAILMARPQKV